MRSLAFFAVLGTSIAVTLTGQSLTEHAAAAAGATIGTAAGKPLGTALGKVFNDSDKVTTKAATPKSTKPVAKPAEEATEHPGAVVVSPSGSGAAPSGAGSIGIVSGGGASVAGSAAKPSPSSGASGTPKATIARRSSRRREAAVASESAPAPVAHSPFPAEPAVAAAPVTSLVIIPEVREPSAQDVANVRVGETAGEIRALLGTPESRVSIPGDDGHLLEICQYWAKGEPIGTVRLDNGRVVSIQLAN